MVRRCRESLDLRGPLFKEYEEQGVIGAGGHLEAKPWGSKDVGVHDPNGAALVFYEDL